MQTNTVTPYRNNCMRPLNEDSVNVMYFDSRKPVENVMGNTIINDAMCGLMEKSFRFRIFFCKIKLYVRKYKVMSNAVFVPPQAAYLNVCSGKSRLKKRV